MLGVLTWKENRWKWNPDRTTGNECFEHRTLGFDPPKKKKEQGYCFIMFGLIVTHAKWVNKEEQSCNCNNFWDQKMDRTTMKAVVHIKHSVSIWIVNVPTATKAWFENLGLDLSV